jgi:chemotaxis protein methyltransferase CheR
MTLSARDFQFVRELLRREAAIVLDDGKEYLVETRLDALARVEGYASLEELLEVARGRTKATLNYRIVEAMTTNETSFWRDVTPFAAIQQKLIPELLEKRRGRRELYVWSAACSTGQEPYSLAMLLKEEEARLTGWHVRLLATDLSRRVLERGKQGTYVKHEVNRGLTPPLLQRYFERVGEDWRVRGALRCMVEWQELNLVRSWPLLPKFDLVLLRNVLIYFDVPTRQLVLSKLREVLQPDGYVLLGAGESVAGLDPAFEATERGGVPFYRLKQPQPAVAPRPVAVLP